MSNLISAALLAALAALLALGARCLIRMHRREQAAVRRALLASQPENLLTAHVRGDSIPAMREAALAKARELYGADADLQVVSTEGVATSTLGGFMAIVRVRHYPSLCPVTAQEAVSA
jgi:hypothetical protein